MWLPFLDPPRKAFLSPSVWSRSIVCIGVSIPPLKNRHPVFLDKPSLNLQTAQAPLYTQSILFYWFFVKSPLWKSGFSINAQILKFFILNSIVTFKSNYILSENFLVWIISNGREKSYQLFLLLNISDLSLFFLVKIATSPPLLPLQQKCGNFLNFIACFGRYLIMPFSTVIFLKIKCAKVVYTYVM